MYCLHRVLRPQFPHLLKAGGRGYLRTGLRIPCIKSESKASTPQEPSPFSQGGAGCRCRVNGCTRQDMAVRATWALPKVSVGHSCHGSDCEGHLWKLEPAAPAAGGVRRGPGHESLSSNEAESQGGVPRHLPPASRSYKGPLRRAPHPHPTPRPSLVLVVGPRHCGLSPGAWPGICYICKKSPSVAWHPQRGGFLAPESLPGQQRIIFAGPMHTTG